jgi:hypothetical protein
MTEPSLRDNVNTIKRLQDENTQLKAKLLSLERDYDRTYNDLVKLRKQLNP